MAFTVDTLKAAWYRAQGRCECERNYHTHRIDNKRCDEELVWENMGKEGEKGGWHAHHIVPVVNGGREEIENCEILCYECHKSAASYGLF